MNLIGIVVYLAMGALALLAFRAAAGRQRPGAERVHWAGVALAFGVLAAVRLSRIEEHLRESLRESLLQQGTYAERGDTQSLAAAAVVMLAAVGMVVVLNMWANRRRAPLARAILVSRLAVAAYIPLYALRIVSFHATDRLLYSAPLHLNWLADGALAAACGASAFYYVRNVANDRRRDRSSADNRDRKDRR